MTQPTPGLDAILDQAQAIKADLDDNPIRRGWVSREIEDFFDHGLPALLAEVERLREHCTEVEEYANDAAILKSGQPWEELFRQRDEAITERDRLREELDRLTPATPKATAAHRWTRHGHHCCSTTVLPESTRPRAIARCGGPAICRECAIDAAQAHVTGDET